MEGDGNQWVFRETLPDAPPVEPPPAPEPEGEDPMIKRRRERARQAAEVQRRVVCIQRRIREFLARARDRQLAKRQAEPLYRATKRVESKKLGTQYFRVELNKHVTARDEETDEPTNWYYTLVGK